MKKLSSVFLLMMVVIFCYSCGDATDSNDSGGTEDDSTETESDADEDDSAEAESDSDDNASTDTGSSGNGVVEISLNGGNYLVMAQDLTDTLTWDEAVATCKNSSGGGYTGWYLPAKGELYSLYERKGDIGGFYDTWYWSSTETNDYNALQQDFGDGKQNAYAGKGGEARVRCVKRE